MTRSDSNYDSVPPGLPFIRAIPKVTAVAGETMEIKCPVAGFPIEEIKWERGTVEYKAPTPRRECPLSN